jgi:hypothetical protein
MEAQATAKRHPTEGRMVRIGERGEMKSRLIVLAFGLGVLVGLS